MADPRPTSSAWYHADFCHAYAWVYEDGDQLRVRWGERSGTDVLLHGKSDCPRCRALRRGTEYGPGEGEFHIAKPDAAFSSTEAFLVVLAELGKWIPHLADEAAAS